MGVSLERRRLMRIRVLLGKECVDIAAKNAVHPPDLMGAQLAGSDQPLHRAHRHVQEGGGVLGGVNRPHGGDDGPSALVAHASPPIGPIHPRPGAGSSALVRRENPREPARGMGLPRIVVSVPFVAENGNFATFPLYFRLLEKIERCASCA
jgi:hypothetical protein